MLAPIRSRTFQLYGEAIEWAGTSCDVGKIDITAKDYKYEGVPTKMSVGYHVVDFSNEGQEQQEMFTFTLGAAASAPATRPSKASASPTISRSCWRNCMALTPSRMKTLSSGGRVDHHPGHEARQPAARARGG